MQTPVQTLQTFRFTFDAMAASGEVVLACTSEPEAHDLAQSAIHEVQRIEKKYSRYLADSVVTEINRNAGHDWVECDEETLSLLDYADTLFHLSDGLFDITSGVLRQAWDFKQGIVPTQINLEPLLKRIGWERVERKTSLIHLPEIGMEIDFGGFGKEYAADRAAEILAVQGVAHGYVNLAGDLNVIGPRPDGLPWVIGIQHPRQSGQLLATIPVDRGGLATSGDYERFFELAGQRYCHVLNPKTGLPVTHWRSVSVLAPRAVIAGSCSTIAMLKQKEGLQFLEDSGLDFLAMDDLAHVHQQTFATGKAIV